MSATYPLSAIVGQDALREALLACAVDPRIGGVLVRGERGTAKSTAVRALAPLLGGPLVELPVGATADRLVGALDVERALGGGAVELRPGLLAGADGGALYADEVNLLPDHLVDVLLDAAASGVVRVERDGLSAAAPARFVLVGTMNPEEGELRPQLLDRFGLSVEVAGSRDVGERVEVVRRRMAFDADPSAFAADWSGQEESVRAALLRAQELLPSVVLGDRALRLVASVCASLGVDGLRADIVCARTAVALCALDGATEVGEEHVRRAALLALAHRRRRGPMDPPGLSEDELDDAMGDADPSDEPEPEPEPDPPASAPDPSGVDLESPGDHNSTRAAPAPAPERVEASSDPVAPPWLSLEGRGRGAAGRRSRASGTGGAPVDARPVTREDAPDLSVVATLRAAATRGARAPELRDLREHVRAGREGTLVVFAVDASGSMGARRRMALVKGAVLGLLLDAYQRRDRVAVVAFRGEGAQLVLAPTRSVEQAAAQLEALATGGTSPIAAGLDRATELVLAERRRDPDRRALALVVTDGRASGGPAGREAAADAAGRLGRSADGVVVFDCEQGAVRLGLAGALADAAGARVLPLDELARSHPQPHRSAA